ncbi:MAG: hypothetical protein Q9224_007692, partial [Gallowayella concinna]
MFLREKQDFSKRALVALVFALCTLSLFLWQFSTTDSVFQKAEPLSKENHDSEIGISQEDKLLNSESFPPSFGALNSPHDQVIGANDTPLPSAKFRQSAIDLPFEVYDPYPDYNSKAWKAQWYGSHSACEGPRGVNVNGNPDDMLGAYKLPSHVTLPVPFFGSYEETGLGSGFCFEHRARNRAYGEARDEDDLPTNGPHPVPPPSSVEWASVDWGRLQKECYVRNRDRFEDAADPRTPIFRFPNDADIQQVDSTLILPQRQPESQRSSSRSSEPAGSKAYKK